MKNQKVDIAGMFSRRAISVFGSGDMPMVSKIMDRLLIDVFLYAMPYCYHPESGEIEYGCLSFEDRHNIVELHKCITGLCGVMEKHSFVSFIEGSHMIGVADAEMIAAAFRHMLTFTTVAGLLEIMDSLRATTTILKLVHSRDIPTNDTLDTFYFCTQIKEIISGFTAV